MKMFQNQIYTDKETNEWILTLFPSINNETNEEFIVYHRLNKRGQVYVSKTEDFLNKHKWHDPYPNLAQDLAE
jgi:hypothetical protein